MKSSNLFVFSLLFSAQLFAQGQSSNNKAFKIPESNGYSFTTYDAGVNSELSEIGTAFFMNKYLILSNKKRGFSTVSVDPKTNTPNHNLFCVDFDKNGNLSRPVIFSKLLDSDSNEGGVTFSADQKTIYLTRAKESNSKQFSLYKATLDLQAKGFWKDIQELTINGNYSIETPFMSPNGQKIYFSSDKKGGFGGYDLYSADVLADGTLTNVTNLGPTVNSAKDEKYPYVSGDNRHIYFSSNGHETFGGYDVFRASNVNNGFINRSNLGETINTNNDEIAFTYSHQNQGYISSNRKTDKSDFDIYKFELVVLEQNFNALVEENKSKTALPNTEVVVKNEFGDVIKTLKTDNNGKFSLKMNPMVDYTIETKKEGYEPNIYRFKPNGNSLEYKGHIALNQLKAKVTNTAIEIENIYFAYNKVELQKESELSLNKILDVLHENPEMKISINAHSDSKGKAAYNMALSEKRAESTYNYLIQNGISKDRLTYKGYGKSQLKFKCNGNCPEALESQNRRVEFIIKK
ncbi:OmpA family protein [Flavobacterium cerinum]|uniref:OmpA family protein n=1 Tax=Flavobacterium cerinum TaxID=2502784 RepID=A0ABY5IXX5_9FLAO|nr:OmpA family protein [Flavobacterium cerinum]UUC46563.1 OmpA family protein [Flavobacterium cerinum]